MSISSAFSFFYSILKNTLLYMATAAVGRHSMKLQIYVDKKRNRVVFAEAKKDFVDFIFHILSLPLGAVQRILSTRSTTFGSIGSLQEGLKNLDEEYTEKPGKAYLLGLKAPYWGKNTTLLLPSASCSNLRPFYQCHRDKSVHVERQISYSSGVGDHVCGCWDHPEINLMGNSLYVSVVRGNEKGYVKEAATFIVMDDLVVRPAGPTSVFTLMNQHSIKDVAAIEKREVSFGTVQAIKLLKASVSSKRVLTEVFLD